MMKAKLAAAQKGECARPVAVVQPNSGKLLDGLRSPWFWPATMPELFPDSGALHCFGKADTRKSKLTAEDYVDHLLRSADPRWREHAQFAFVAFNLLQKKRIFRSCTQKIKAKRVVPLTEYLPLLEEDHIEAAINDLRTAEFHRGFHSMEDISNPDARELFTKLFSQLRLVSGQLDLTDHSRLHQRKLLYSRNINMGLPDLFLTVNPGDANAPLFLRLAGETLEEGADALWKSFPDKQRRLLLATRNPVAATIYANCLMNAFLTGLLGYTTDGTARASVLGEQISAYSFHVEEQGRGTLHYHGFVWFRNRPSPSVMRELLQTNDFQHRVVQWLDYTVRRAEPQVETWRLEEENRTEHKRAEVCGLYRIYDGSCCKLVVAAQNVVVPSSPTARGRNCG